MRRSRVRSVRKDKRKFSRTARKTHVRNIPRRPMRGGIRL